jgi:hypothetical protein
MSTESTVAEPVVAYLREQHWEVYQEVQPRSENWIADIVAVRGPVLWIVEVKKTRSLALLDQAIERFPFAHRVSVAVPIGRSSSPTWDRVRRDSGVGLFEVSGPFVRELCVAKLRARPPKARAFRDSLVEEQKTYAVAGSQCGDRWTPWRSTVTKAEQFVAKNPGCTVREMINAIEHHYATDKTAYSGMLFAIDKLPDKVAIRAVSDGKRKRLYPVKEIDADV